jgi:hypothetical protein
VSLVGLVALSAVILTIEWLVLGRPSFPHPKTITSDAIKIGLAIIAGLIAAVGLTVSYRKQRGEEEKGFTDRYESAAEQLGHEKAAVRLAGVYAMARLADDWEARRQTCIDVLCAYLRMPYDADHAPKVNGKCVARFFGLSHTTLAPACEAPGPQMTLISKERFLTS